MEKKFKFSLLDQTCFEHTSAHTDVYVKMPPLFISANKLLTQAADELLRLDFLV